MKELKQKRLYEKFFKRLLDIICSCATLIILSPLIFLVAIIVHMKLGSPVFFVQERPGRNEKIFKLYKFRTMTDQKDEDGNLLPDELRLTPLGQMLRTTSIDELPELWNILKGDMSIVGPRPLLVDYLKEYNSEQKCRHNVRPGLTGLAQIMGRNNISWDEKFKYDIAYVKNVSLKLDIQIILKTIRVVISRDGISNENLGYFHNNQK